MSNLRSRTTREPVSTSGPRRAFGLGVPSRPGSSLPGAQTNTGACCAKEPERKTALPPPRKRCARGRVVVFDMSKRLSATDISALASMKNVAKCDTWCELQNPVNHRVFERKLRPKPLGRGHACLGVTRRCPPSPPSGASAGGRWPPVRHPARLAQMPSPRRRTPRQSVVDKPRLPVVRFRRAAGGSRPSFALLRQSSSTRPQVRRGYPLNLSISISGGKETYEDSPSNGERTGNSPA